MDWMVKKLMMESMVRMQEMVMMDIQTFENNQTNDLPNKLNDEMKLHHDYHLQRSLNEEVILRIDNGKFHKHQIQTSSSSHL
jgi:hypothetical protein